MFSCTNVNPTTTFSPLHNYFYYAILPCHSVVLCFLIFNIWAHWLKCRKDSAGHIQIIFVQNQHYTADAWHCCWCDFVQPCPNMAISVEGPLAIYSSSTVISLACDWAPSVWFSLWNPMVNKTKWRTWSQHPSTFYIDHQDGFDISNTLSDSRKKWKLIEARTLHWDKTQ